MAFKKMRRVTEATSAEESRGTMRNGQVTEVKVWKVWILTLACGHRERRVDDGGGAPSHVACHMCPRSGVRA